jgi:hypothetical protein
VWNAVRSFFDFDGPAVLNVRARLVIGFMKQHIVQLPHINHFSASAALVKVPFFRFAQFVKGGFHSSIVGASYSRRKGAPRQSHTRRAHYGSGNQKQW